MLKNFLFFVVLLQFNFAFCQDTEKSKFNNHWTFGTIILNEASGPLGYDKFSPNFFSGITLERHFQLLTVRLGVEYFQDNYSSNDCQNCIDIGLYSYDFKEGMMRLGVSKGIVIKDIFKLYAATDFSILKNSNIGFTRGGMGQIYQDEEEKGIGFGFIPAIGLDFLITSRISLGIESRWNFIRYNSSTKVYDLTTKINSTYDRKYSENYFERIGAFRLNLNF